MKTIETNWTTAEKVLTTITVVLFVALSITLSLIGLL